MNLLNTQLGEYLELVDKEHCTEDQWRNFFTSPCWTELMDTINVRLAIIRDSLEGEDSLDQIRLMQGEAIAFRYMLGIRDLIEAEFKKEITDGTAE